MQESTQTETAMVRPETRNDGGNGEAIIRPDDSGPVYEDDVLVPRYAVIQPTSKEGTPGTFRSNLDGSERSELRVAPLRVQRGRVLWSAEIGTDPICRSTNGLDPSPLIERPVSETCCVIVGRRLQPACPKAVWPRHGRPECRDTYLLVALDLSTETPFAMGFHGAAIRTIKIIRTLAWQRRVALHDLECLLKLRRETSAKGNYFLPIVTAVQPVSPAGKHRAWSDRFARLDVGSQFENGNGNGQSDDGRAF
ncbi:MAG: hypothetical protein HY905_03980 [Deltaproteobacteria bacterium]|nr:hypothetical protein [Deltaproteobacteria bacterium]